MVIVEKIEAFNNVQKQVKDITLKIIKMLEAMGHNLDNMTVNQGDYAIAFFNGLIRLEFWYPMDGHIQIQYFNGCIGLCSNQKYKGLFKFEDIPYSEVANELSSLLSEHEN